MRQRRSWAVALLACMSLMFVGVTRAEPDVPPSDTAREQASGHFQRGVELFQEGAFRAALVEFERAYGIAPDYRLLYNIGQVKLQLQDYLGATQSYESYLEQGGADIPEARRDDVEKAFETLRQRVGRIAIAANRDGAELFVDDLRVGVTPMAATIAVNVGRHRVLARSEDGASASKVIDIAGGDLIDVALELKAPEVKPVVIVKTREPLSTKKRAAIGSWAVGGVALAVAGVTALLAQGEVDARNKELDKPLPNAGKASDLSSSADSYALTTDVLAAVGVVGIGTGVVLWLIDDEPKAKATDVKPVAAGTIQWGVGFGTVTAHGAF